MEELNDKFWSASFEEQLVAIIALLQQRIYRIHDKDVKKWINKNAARVNDVYAMKEEH